MADCTPQSSNVDMGRFSEAKVSPQTESFGRLERGSKYVCSITACRRLRNESTPKPRDRSRPSGERSHRRVNRRTNCSGSSCPARTVAANQTRYARAGLSEIEPARLRQRGEIERCSKRRSAEQFNAGRSDTLIKRENPSRRQDDAARRRCKGPGGRRR